MRRGVIYNKARSQQINDFGNMAYGNITPTDIDGLIEYKDKGYIFYEIKYGDKEVPRGQRLALQRLIDDIEKAGKIGCVVIAEHDIQDTDESVPLDGCRVRELYFAGKWWANTGAYANVKELTDRFIGLINKAR